MHPKAPRYWDDYEIGQRFDLGSTSFTADEIVDFARQYDPQSFHVDAGAARQSMFGGLIASGWHVTAKLMRLFVDPGWPPDARETAYRWLDRWLR